MKRKRQECLRRWQWCERCEQHIEAGKGHECVRRGEQVELFDKPEQFEPQLPGLADQAQSATGANKVVKMRHLNIR